MAVAQLVEHSTTDPETANSKRGWKPNWITLRLSQVRFRIKLVRLKNCVFKNEQLKAKSAFETGHVNRPLAHNDCIN
jgi:hypothetical protein